MTIDDNLIWVILIFFSLIMVGSLISAFVDPPTQEELEQAEGTMVTPECYYFCGPWYMWMVSWLGVVFAGVLAIGVIQRFRKSSEAREQ